MRAPMPPRQRTTLLPSPTQLIAAAIGTEFVGTAAICAAAIWIASFAGCTAAPPDTTATARPNIILVSIDSLRADHVGAYGYEKPTTPFLDRLAREGAKFQSAISSTSWTLPAHASLFTGLASSAHRTRTPQSRLADDYETLAEVLGSHGYNTLGLYSGPFLHPDFGLDQGFQRYIDCTTFGVGERDPRKSHGASHRDVTNPVLAAKASQQFDDLGPEPYFLFLHMWDVHYELIPPENYRLMFDEGYRGNFDGRDFRHEPGFAVGMDGADFAHVLALYDGEIRYTDDTLAKIIGLLESTGKLDNTIIAVVSDHGDEFLEHGDKGHRHTLYQELIRIPLIVWMPGRVSPAIIGLPVSITDIAPTLLDLAGLPPLPGAMGRSLRRALEGEVPEPKPVLAELVAPPRAPDSSAVLLAHGKLIVDHKHNKATYYNLATDPAELTPIPAEQSREAAALLGAMVKLKKQALSIAAEHSEREDIELPAKLRERLDKLGYLD